MRKKSELGKSQTEDVLRFMREEGSITSMDAIKEFGATRLSAIIFNLRDRGYDIETRMEVSKNRYGHIVEYARYVLHEES
jgi:hypothetical protein